ncbi:MAG: excinuclease ABC subunit UvrB [Bacteroidetes bacterium]|nr:excinuclease ABC subunit UvrB [Bacteroidota bacterium]
MAYDLVSDYTPQGDQPEAIKQLIEGINRGDKHQVLLGVTGSGKTFTISNVIKEFNMPVLVMSHNKTLAAQLYAEFKSFFPKNRVEYFISYYDYYQPEAYIPTTDTYIAKDSSINDEIDRLRLRTTSSLLSQDPNVIVVSSVSSIYGIGTPDEWLEQLIPIQLGMKITRNELLKKLVNIHYVRNDYEFTRGTFRVRGDVFDVIPAYENEHALRVQFFDDEVEKIQIIDRIDGTIISESDYEVIYPAKQFLTSQQKIESAVIEIKKELSMQVEGFREVGKYLEAQRIEQRTRFDIEMMLEVGYCSGIENYSRHMAARKPGSRPFCLFDYFPKNFLVVIDESHVSIPQIGGMYHGDRSRKETLVEYGFRLPSALDNRPLRFDEWENLVPKAIYVSATPGDYEFKKSGGAVVEQLIRPTGLLDPEVDVRPIKNQIDNLIAELRARVEKHERVLVTTLTKRMAEDLCGYLENISIKVRYIHSEVPTLERVEILRGLRLGDFDVLIGVNLLREGLDLPEVSLVAILDADKEGFLRSERSLIQTAGRTARNANGKVIMYADKITNSMKKMIDETTRRREIQIKYNLENNIMPKTIYKSYDEIIASTTIADAKSKDSFGNKKTFYQPLEDTIITKLDSAQKNDLIEELEIEMLKASKEFEYERAAQLRDEITRLKILISKK